MSFGSLYTPGNPGSISLTLNPSTKPLPVTLAADSGSLNRNDQGAWSQTAMHVAIPKALPFNVQENLSWSGSGASASYVETYINGAWQDALPGAVVIPAGAAAAKPMPFIVTFTRREMAMKYGDPLNRKTHLEAFNGLRS